MTRVFILISIGISTLSLSMGIYLTDYPSTMAFSILLGSAWVFIYMRGYLRFNSLLFAIFTLTSTFCLWIKVSPIYSITAVLFSLLAWDLIHFHQRLQMTTHKGDIRTMERKHFTRLTVILALSIAGYAAINLIQVSLTFGAAALLALLGIWGISALVYRLRSHE